MSSSSQFIHDEPVTAYTIESIRKCRVELPKTDLKKLSYDVHEIWYYSDAEIIRTMYSYFAAHLF